MKKLSLLISLILCVTIGGVYAAWNYAGTSTEISTHTSSPIVLTGADQNEKAGTYTLVSNIQGIRIEPETQENKKATLVPVYTNGNVPTLTLTFTPAVDAGDAIETDALETYVYFGIATDYQWNSTSVFTFTHDVENAIKINKATATVNEGEYKWEKQGTNFTCTIVLEPTEERMTQIGSLADLVEIADITLPTIDDYNAFFAAIGSDDVSLHMHATNVNPDPTPAG